MTERGLKKRKVEERKRKRREEKRREEKRREEKRISEIIGMSFWFQGSVEILGANGLLQY